MVSKVIRMIKDFLDNNYDPKEFSYDLPNKLVDLYDQMEKENKPITLLLNDDLPDICSWYDTDSDEEGCLNEIQFKEKVKIEYEKALKLL